MRKFKEYVCFTKLAKELYLVQENLWTTCVRSPSVEGFFSLKKFLMLKKTSSQLMGLQKEIYSILL